MCIKYLIRKELTMSKNRVQFQPGQSLRDFFKRYGTDEQCAQALFQARWPQGFRCPHCGYHKHCQRRWRKALQCNRCKHQSPLIAGTAFENTKLGLSSWFLAMYLLTQSKNGISAMDLKRQLGVSYNSAWMVKHKLMQAMREREDSQPLRGVVELDHAYLGGQTSGVQRGRGAVRKMPFLAAAQVSAEGHPEWLRLSPVIRFRRWAVESWALQQLQPGTVVRSDGLRGFRGVLAVGCEHPHVSPAAATAGARRPG